MRRSDTKGFQTIEDSELDVSARMAAISREAAGVAEPARVASEHSAPPTPSNSLPQRARRFLGRVRRKIFPPAPSPLPPPAPTAVRATPHRRAPKLAWVIPWYGENIPGGAEAQCRATARELLRAGFDVEILTTCVKEFQSDWSHNFHPPGVEESNGLVVRRFPAEARDATAFDAINAKLMAGERVSLPEEEVFLRNMIRSQALVDHMRATAAESIFLPIPYMFGTTLEGTLACPERTVLVPCLHDEPYAYFESFRRMFLAARGAIFHAPAEAALAQRLYGFPAEKSFVVGGGIDPVEQAQAERFRAKYGVKDFLLYAGRKDESKNVPLLIHYFCAYKDLNPSDLKLLLIGNGQLPIPPAHAGVDVIDLGFVSRQDKHDAYTAALALCQPSRMESFSIVALEAWSAGTPALVHGDCEVTREHCELNQGGLWFRNFGEFAGALNFFRHHPVLRDRMGRNGREYVAKNFRWPEIMRKYENVFRELGFKIDD